MYPRVTWDMLTKLREEHCLQQTCLQYSTADNTKNHKKLLMPQSYRGCPTKLGEEHWLNIERPENATGENGSILRYFFRFPLQGMHGICCHVSVFLIRPSYFEDIDFLVCRPYISGEVFSSATYTIMCNKENMMINIGNAIKTLLIVGSKFSESFLPVSPATEFTFDKVVPNKNTWFTFHCKKEIFNQKNMVLEGTLLLVKMTWCF